MPETTSDVAPAKAKAKARRSAAKTPNVGAGGTLVVVESPAKATTIEKYLGPGFTVLASMGHVRDLPKSQMGVAFDDAGVHVDYEETARGKKVVAELKRVSKGGEVVLATDPDREGEAIAWHIATAMGLAPRETKRVSFTEITKSAVQEAFNNPRTIDQDLVDAQQARRVVDRVVGYKLSPVLWKAVKYGLSAGRVQSAALRLIVDRENEIRAFVPQEYWDLTAGLAAADGTFNAKHPFTEKEKFRYSSGTDMHAVRDACADADWTVADVRRTERSRNPSPPFTTSTLQQEASRKLGFSAKRTMSVAQSLYEGVELPGEGAVGLITYMRTDSTNLSETALADLTRQVREAYGERYALKTPRTFSKKAERAQEAHEAVRPTEASRTPESVRAHLDNDEFRLYDLVWKRAMASQMAAAVFDATSVDISAQPRNGGDAVPFRASGQVMRFDGFLRLYVETDEDRTDDDAQGDRRLPDLQAGQRLELRSLDAEGHFTEPPPRFTEASLVKRMEELGIGRPSTYAPTITTLQTRKYIRVESRRLYPEEVGEVVVRVLAEVFDKVIDTEFTRQMEDELDAVASGDEPWEPLVRRYHDELVAAIPAKPPSVEESTEIECPECGAETGATMNRRYGRYGWFLSCSRYPDCKARMRVDQSGQPVAETEPEVADEPCPLCGDKMYVRDGRFGRFYGCSRYPKCKGLVNLDALLGFACPTCGDTDGGQLVQKRTKRGKPFAGCNRYPTCDFVVWTLPLTTPCPQCAGPLEVLKGGDAHCLKCGTSLTSTEVAETAAAAVTAQQAAPAV